MGEIKEGNGDVNRLELGHRNRLQWIIISEFQKIHSKEAEDILLFSELVEEFSKHLSDIIDAPERENIRVLARAGNYEEAANLVFDLLGMARPVKAKDDDLKKAA